MIFAIGMILGVIGYLVARAVDNSRSYYDRLIDHFPSRFYWAVAVFLLGGAMCLASLAMVAWRTLP